MTTASFPRNRLRVALCLGLILVTAVLYWPMLHHGFVNVDDEAYITQNPHVQSGLTGPGFVWAFQIGYAAYWHPLTWLSHMLDCQWYGLNPAGHHLTNLLFHLANTLLLFVWLNQLTGALWRSALVAALFAWHPLHVESVAWACERKDVLSAFFWMLALITYTHYAQKRSKVEGRESSADTAVQALDTRHWALDYTLALFFFACGLMSKPMVVTLPFVLLLIDFWPLNRFQPACSARTATKLIVEKLPFFVLALAGSIVTYFSQKGGGAVWSAGLPLPVRLANVLVSYLRYISKIFWPVDLAVVYPYSHHWPAGLVICAALLLAAWSGLFLWRIRQNPYLFTGWLWFLGTLVPAIGIVQVGPQSMADRFTYLPAIGFFILIVWGGNDFLDYRPQWQRVATAAEIAALAGCLVCTRIQLSCWQNSVILLRHTLAVTTDNYIACNFLGRALDDLGPNNESMLLYAEAVRIEPHYAQAQFNLGIALLYRGWPEKASESLAAAVRLMPDNAEARYYLGTALLNSSRLDAAAAEFNRAILLKPGFAGAHFRLAQVLQRQNKPADAIRHFREFLRLMPDFTEAKKELDEILAVHPELR
jgi:Flp pilus assembly protein TadD